MNKHDLLSTVYADDDTATLKANALKRYVAECEELQSRDADKIASLEKQLREANSIIKMREDENLSLARELGDNRIKLSGINAKLEVMVELANSRKRQANLDKLTQPRNFEVDLYA